MSMTLLIRAHSFHIRCRYYYSTFTKVRLKHMPGPLCMSNILSASQRRFTYISKILTLPYLCNIHSTVFTSEQSSSSSSSTTYRAPGVSVRGYTAATPLTEPVTVTIREMRKFLASHLVKFEQGYTCFSMVCPRLGKKATTAPAEVDMLFINLTTGWFVCNHCQKSGTWNQLEDNINSLKFVKGTLKRRKEELCFPELSTDTGPGPSAIQLWQCATPISDVSQNLVQDLMSASHIQGLKLSTLSLFSVRVDAERKSLLLPFFSADQSVKCVKRLSEKVGSDNDEVKEALLPRGSLSSGIFGWGTVSPETDEIVLTASVLDAMAVTQDTKIPALTLPRGHLALPQQLLPMLERFKKIILWFNSDVRSWEAAKQFAKKLAERRCYIIRPQDNNPSPMTALQERRQLSKILQKSSPVNHRSITAFHHLRHDVYQELTHAEQVAGIKWRRYPTLNKLLKGHRRGELTIFTGPTGSGKTTFISDYSLDLCIQGVNTLWGSFELSNVRLMKKMLTQFAQMNLSKNVSQFDEWADRFEHLPLYFMTFHGQETLKKIIETMSHSVYVHDIAHIVLDNLQFMMGVSYENPGLTDKFSRQDQIIAAFRNFATNMNCHVTLVVHPRKERDSEELTTSSIYGSAKATQEADNVLILQQQGVMGMKGRKYIQITKNRFDGELGIMLLKFDKDTQSFSVPVKKREPKMSDESEHTTTDEQK